MSSVKEWVDNASDDEIVDVILESEASVVLGLWSALSDSNANIDRTIRIHQRVSRRLVHVLTSETFKVYQNHEDLVPDHAKAQFTINESVSVGDLVGKVGDVVGLNDPDIRVGPRVGENVTLDGAFVEVGLVDLKVGAFVG